MPATHLISVDLPAPLSPTSAITSPARTSKSTSSSACTDPKVFVIPRSSSGGAGVAMGRDASLERDGVDCATPSLRVFLAAVLRVLAHADLALLERPVLEQNLVAVGPGLRLREPDGLQQDRLRPADLAVYALYLLVLEERDRGRRGGIRLEAVRLVDRASLPAGED